MNWPERPGRPIDALSLSVSREILDRVVRLISGVEKAVKDRGYCCSVCANDPRNLEIGALGTRFCLRIREKLREVKHELTDDERRQIKRYGRALFAPKWDLKPKGELELFYGRSANSWYRHSWRDTKLIKLEDSVHDLFLWMILDADCQRSEQARREGQRRREAELRARREKLEAEQKVEQRRIDRLVSDANARRQSEVIRSYINAVMIVGVAIRCCGRTAAGISGAERRC